MEERRPITGISEVVLRVEDIDAVRAFYVDVVGLELWRSSPGFVFLKVADVDSPLGRESHPQVVALVDRDEHPWEWPGIDYRSPDPARSSLDHIAFEIHPDTIESERERLEDEGLDVAVVTFPFLRARGLFFRDPEGNVVEFLAHDPDVGG